MEVHFYNNERLKSFQIEIKISIICVISSMFLLCSLDWKLNSLVFCSLNICQIRKTKIGKNVHAIFIADLYLKYIKYSILLHRLSVILILVISKVSSNNTLSKNALFYSPEPPCIKSRFLSGEVRSHRQRPWTIKYCRVQKKQQ